MSNSWNYTLVFENSISFQMVFTAILETINVHGYSIWNRESPKITGMSNNGVNELEFDKLDVAAKFFCSEGGLLNLHKYFRNDWVNTLHVTLNPTRQEISFGALHDLRVDRDEDVQIATDLQNIFTTLCHHLEPIYGYSVDDYGLETIFQGNDLLQEFSNFRSVIRNKGIPPVLFWLNYFSADYYHQIGEQVFKNTPHRKENISHGTFVFLAEHPWENHVATLEQNGYRIIW